MTNSAMETIDKIRAFSDVHGLLPPGACVLAAVSGGADSVCLLSCLLALSSELDLSVAVAHFNHRLRGDASDRDQLFVSDLCRDLHIPFYTDGADVASYARDNKLGIEAAARNLRYAFFEQTAKKIGADRIATAHTADDNAETVLLNLTRGTGLRGLGGIPPMRGSIVRPMLTVTRREVLAHLENNRLHYVEDATNAQDIYARNRVRRHVVPVLSEINPRFAETVTAAAMRAREDDAFLSKLAQDFIDENVDGDALIVSALLSQPRPVAARAIRALGGSALTAGHVDDILALCRSDAGSQRLSLPGITLIREYDRLLFNEDAQPTTLTPINVFDGLSASLPQAGITVTCRAGVISEKINSSFITLLFKCDSICGKIVIRSRKTGDKMTLFGRNGTKTLKKLFIEKRIPVSKRSLIPVIADDVGVLGVYGIGIDKRAHGRIGDAALEIRFEEPTYEK